MEFDRRDVAVAANWEDFRVGEAQVERGDAVVRDDDGRRGAARRGVLESATAFEELAFGAEFGGVGQEDAIFFGEFGVLAAEHGDRFLRVAAVSRRLTEEGFVRVDLTAGVGARFEEFFAQAAFFASVGGAEIAERNGTGRGGGGRRRIERG